MKTKELKIILRKMNKNNIAIIGHMGSGKSHLGKILAKKLYLDHFDSDLEITNKLGKSINLIFNTEGEEYFRKIEKQTLNKLIKKKNIILSLGGGSILNKSSRDIIKNKSITIFLDVNLGELVKRLKKSTGRPLLKNVNIKEKVKELDSVRRKYYLRADIIINNTGISPHKTCENIFNKLYYLSEKNY